jgi:hypothetical protein
MPSLRVRSHKRDLRRFGGTPPGSAPPRPTPNSAASTTALRIAASGLTRFLLVVNAADVEYEREQS